MQRKRVADYYSTVGAGEDTLEKRRSDWSRDKATTQRGGYDPLQAISFRLTEATSDRPCHSAGRLGCVPRDTSISLPCLSCLTRSLYPFHRAPTYIAISYSGSRSAVVHIRGSCFSLQRPPHLPLSAGCSQTKVSVPKHT
jgi:hypothetical protein